VAWQALGRCARLIHSVRLDDFGETPAGFRAGEAQAEWASFVQYNLDSLTAEDELIRLGVYQPDQAGQIRAWFAALQAAAIRLGLNHGDLSPWNTLIAPDGQVSLLDWGSAAWHLVPHYDFIHLLREYPPAASETQLFLQGYGLTETEYARLLPELRSLLVLKEFDLTRWALARCPERITEIAARARTALHNRLEAAAH
jgi:serine/threonine protein kinase